MQIDNVLQVNQPQRIKAPQSVCFCCVLKCHAKEVQVGLMDTGDYFSNAEHAPTFMSMYVAQLNAPARLQGATIDEELLMKVSTIFRTTKQYAHLSSLNLNSCFQAFSPAAHRDIYHVPDSELPKQMSKVNWAHVIRNFVHPRKATHTHTHTHTRLLPQVTTSSDKFGFDTLIADARMMVGGRS